MLRLAEGLVTATAQQRAALHDLVASARALQDAAAWMDRLPEEGQEEEGALPAQVCLSGCACFVCCVLRVWIASELR